MIKNSVVTAAKSSVQNNYVLYFQSKRDDIVQNDVSYLRKPSVLVSSSTSNSRGAKDSCGEIRPVNMIQYRRNNQPKIQVER